MKKQIHFGSKSCKNNFNLEFESQYELEKAIQTEVSRATVAEEELLNRLQGISEDSSSVTDPFKFLGEFDSYDKLNETLDTLTYSLGHQKGYGYFRARVGTMAIDIKSILVSSAHNAVGQVVQGMLTLNGDKKLTLANGTYKIYFRKHQNNAWSDWKDITTATSNSGSSSGGDINLSDYVTKVEFEEVENDLLTRISDVESDIPDVRINNESIVEDATVNLEEHFKTINDKSIFASENDTSLKCVEKVLIDGDIHLNPEDGVLDLRGVFGESNLSDYATKTELQNTKNSIHTKIDFQDTQLREMIEDVEKAALKGIKLNSTPIAPDDDGYINLELSGNGDITVDPNDVYATKVALEEVENDLLTRIEGVQSDIPDIRINNESIINDSKVANLEEHFKTINNKPIFASENDTSLQCVEKVLIDGDIHLNPEDGVLDLRGVFGESNLSDYVTKVEFEAERDSVWGFLNGVEELIPAIKINGESIINDSNVANIPVASTTELGVTKLATEINENSDDEHAVTPAAVYWELDTLRAETKNLYGQKIYTNSPIGGVAYLTPLKQGKTIVTGEISGIESFILQGSVDDERYMEFYLAFKTAATIGSFAFPNDLIWANGVTPTIEEDTYYELSIVVVNMKSNNEDQDILIRKAVLTPFK